MGLCGTALGLAWADRRLTPEERQEIARGERDERNTAIREKAAYTSWFWSLYLLWALWAFTLVAQGYVRGRSRRRHCAPLCVLPGEHEALGQKTVRGYSKC